MKVVKNAMSASSGDAKTEERCGVEMLEVLDF
jgi:hypothetical protein